MPTRLLSATAFDGAHGCSSYDPACFHVQRHPTRAVEGWKRRNISEYQDGTADVADEFGTRLIRFRESQRRKSRRDQKLEKLWSHAQPRRWTVRARRLTTARDCLA